MEDRMFDMGTLWQDIVSQLSEQSRDIQTIHRNGCRGKWFHAEIYLDRIHICNARYNAPSSTINSFILKSEFSKLYPLFFLWKMDKISREEAKGVPASWKSSYIFALIYTYINIDI